MANKSNIKISIITVCYNSEKTIKRTLDSLLSQTYQNFEYIIVDGLSSDNTLEIIKSFEPSFKSKNISFKVISEPDNGMYDAMNKGIKISSGEIVGIINSDDWFEPNALETVASSFKLYNYDLFFANLRIIKANGKEMIKKAKIKRFITSRNWNHPTTFVKRTIYNELGLFSLHSIYDDWDFYLRVRRAKKKIYISNVVLANFTFGGISNKKSFKSAMARCRYRYWCYRNNHYSRFYWIECFIMEFVKYLLS